MSLCKRLERLYRVTLLVAVFCHFSLVLGNSPGDSLIASKQYQQQADMQVTLAVPTFNGSGFAVLADATLLIEGPPFLPQTLQNPLSRPLVNDTQPVLILPQDTVSDSSGTTEHVGSSRMLVMGYYPDWVGSQLPPNKINFTRFDWIDFAFAVPTADLTLAWDDPGAPTLLTQLVTLAHSYGSKVKLSIGGWTGSKHFSTVVGDADSREKFVTNILATYTTYELDGIDIDWEYPGRIGSPGNGFNTNDTSNFLLFLQALRAALPAEARISAAVEPTPFLDGQGQSITDATAFAQVLDWVLIMDYDDWDSSPNPGPNAPLGDACGNSTQPDASAVGSFNAWTKAKFPASKLVLGLPSYGYISSSTANRLRTRSKPKKNQRRPGSLKVVDEDGDSDGQVQFRDLVAQGALLATNDTTRYVASGGFEGLWDFCSSTPYLRSSSSNQVITYDSPTSLGMKAAFAKQVGMLGVNIFDIHGDTDDWDLINTIRKSMDLI